MDLLCMGEQLVGPQRRVLLAGGLGGAAAVAAYRDDLTQLQFDASTALGSLLTLLDAESAHVFGVWVAKHGLVPRESRPDPPSLRTSVWGRDFPSPIGMAVMDARAGTQPRACPSQW